MATKKTTQPVKPVDKNAETKQALTKFLFNLIKGVEADTVTVSDFKGIKSEHYLKKTDDRGNIREVITGRYDVSLEAILYDTDTKRT